MRLHVRSLEEQFHYQLHQLQNKYGPARESHLSSIHAWAEKCLTPADTVKYLLVPLKKTVPIHHDVMWTPASRFLTLEKKDIGYEVAEVIHYFLTHPCAISVELAPVLTKHISKNLQFTKSWLSAFTLPILRLLKNDPVLAGALKKARNPARRAASARYHFGVDYTKDLLISLLAEPSDWPTLYTKYRDQLSADLIEQFTTLLTEEHFAVVTPDEWPLVLLDRYLYSWAQPRLSDIPPLPNSALSQLAAKGSPSLRAWVLNQLHPNPSRPTI